MPLCGDHWARELASFPRKGEALAFCIIYAGQYCTIRFKDNATQHCHPYVASNEENKMGQGRDQWQVVRHAGCVGELRWNKASETTGSLFSQALTAPLKRCSFQPHADHNAHHFLVNRKPLNWEQFSYRLEGNIFSATETARNIEARLCSPEWDWVSFFKKKSLCCIIFGMFLHINRECEQM